jgi:hypothetical protein
MPPTPGQQCYRNSETAPSTPHHCPSILGLGLCATRAPRKVQGALVVRASPIRSGQKRKRMFYDEIRVQRAPNLPLPSGERETREMAMASATILYRGGAGTMTVSCARPT